MVTSRYSGMLFGRTGPRGSRKRPGEGVSRYLGVWDMSRWRTVAVVTLSVGLALVASGCVGSPSPRAKPNMKIAAIVYSGSGGSPAILALYRAALEVNKRASDFELSVVQVSPNDVAGPASGPSKEPPAVTALEQAMGQDAPDLVLFASATEYDAAADKGLLQPLDSFLRSDQTIKREDFFPGTLEAVTDEGQLIYGLPLSVSTLSLQYDRRAFDAAGVPYPDGTWNWTTFVNTLQAVTRATGNPQTDQYGISEPGTNFLLSLIWQNGGEIISKDGTHSLIAEAPAVEAIQYYADLSRRYKVIPPTFRPGGSDAPPPVKMTTRVAPGEVPPLMSPLGRVAMSATFGVGQPGYRGPGYAGSGSDRPIRLVALPRGKTQATYVDTNTILSVTTNSANQRLAYKALLSLATEMSKDIGMPTQRSLARSFKTSSTYLTDEEHQVILNALEHGRALPLHRRDKVMRAISSKLFGPLQTGTKSVLELAKDTAEAVDDALNGVESATPTPAPGAPQG